MLSRLLALASCAVIASNLYGAELHKLGPLGDRLSSEDMAAITAVAVNTGAPWAIEGWRSQVLPLAWYVDVFLEPARSTETLRRGQVVHLECSPRPEAATCGIWKSAAANGAYAQITDSGTGFSHLPVTAASRERPIRLVGDFSDADLLALVTYIRSGPSPHSAKGNVGGMSLPGDLPITDIQLEANRSARAWLSATHGVGFSARFRHRGHGWLITEVVGGVA